MHSHIHAVSSNLLNPYSATALERREVAQRASETRKKLMDASREVTVDLDSDADLAVDHWSQGPQQRHGQQALPGRKEVTAEEPDQVIEPISVWA